MFVINEIDLSKFKFKHHAFLTNGSSILVHDYINDELLDSAQEIEENIHRGYVTNSPYGNSISFEKISLLPSKLDNLCLIIFNSSLLQFKVLLQSQRSRNRPGTERVKPKIHRMRFRRRRRQNR